MGAIDFPRKLKGKVLGSVGMLLILEITQHKSIYIYIWWGVKNCAWTEKEFTKESERGRISIKSTELAKTEEEIRHLSKVVAVKEYAHSKRDDLNLNLLHWSVVSIW